MSDIIASSEFKGINIAPMARPKGEYVPANVLGEDAPPKRVPLGLPRLCISLSRACRPPTVIWPRFGHF